VCNGLGLTGLQGGWLSAMVAARFPHKVNSLVLAGAPIDTDAGDGPIKHMAHEYPISFYDEMVEFGRWFDGKFMLQGWKNMHPWQRLDPGAHRSVRAYRRPGVSCQRGNVRELV
jgi:poly(3-hydroxybutyrate) depolymerase